MWDACFDRLRAGQRASPCEFAINQPRRGQVRFRHPLQATFDRYVVLPSSESRREMLMSGGCPAEVVDRASEANDPVPVRPSAVSPWVRASGER